MALFGCRSLPHRSSLSRFLADVDRPCLEAFRTLFEQRFAEGWTKDTIGGIFDRQGRRYIVFDVDATRQQHDSELCPVIQRSLLRDADSMRSVRQATKDANEGRWSAHAQPLSKCTLANGSVPMGAKGMRIIAVNLPRLSEPLRPT